MFGRVYLEHDLCKESPVTMQTAKSPSFRMATLEVGPEGHQMGKRLSTYFTFDRSTTAVDTLQMGLETSDSGQALVTDVALIPDLLVDNFYVPGEMLH